MVSRLDPPSGHPPKSKPIFFFFQGSAYFALYFLYCSFYFRDVHIVHDVLDMFGAKKRQRQNIDELSNMFSCVLMFSVCFTIV